jgi:hypothetical protein
MVRLISIHANEQDLGLAALRSPLMLKQLD